MLRILLISLFSLVIFGQPLYKIETMAGTAWTGDGRPATSALLVQPEGIGADLAGNLYIADAGDHRVRRVNPFGVIETFAGTGTAGYRGDNGKATEARLRSPYGVAVDPAGNVFIADLGNGVVRRVSPAGQITTVAGGGSEVPVPGSPVKAVKAKLNQPRDLACDRLGNLFISDFGASRIYQITPDGTLGVIASTGLASPAGLAVDPSNNFLYIADSGNGRIKRLAGGVLSVLLGKDGKEAQFSTPTGVAFTTGAVMLIADSGPNITAVAPTHEVFSLPGRGSAITIGISGAVYARSGRVVERLTASGALPVAGSRVDAPSGDGTNPDEWRFVAPSSILRHGGAVWIADAGNGRVRRLTSTDLTTATTAIAEPISLAFDSSARLYVGDGRTGDIYRLESPSSVRVFAQTDGRRMKPSAMAFDSAGNLFIADSWNGVIRRVSPDGKTIALVAGGGNRMTDGPALLAKLGAPAGLAFDAAGALWFSESTTGKLRKFVDGQVTTLTGPDLVEPRGIRFDSKGNLIVADASLNRIFRISPQTGDYVPLAGVGDAGFAGDGDMALSAALNSPFDVLPEPDGTILIADTANNRIRRLRETGNGSSVITPPAVVMPTFTVVHAGTMKEQAVAPGQIVYINGEGFGTAAKVTIGGLSAELLAVTPSRLTAVVPPQVAVGAAEVAVEGAGKAAIDIVATSPAILTAANGKGQALASNDDGSLNGYTKPAGRGSVVTLYVTGEGQQPSQVTAEIAGYTADVLWSGPAPALRGVLQVNVKTPGGFSPSGVVDITISVNGVKTQPEVTLVSR